MKFISRSLTLVLLAGILLSVVVANPGGSVRAQDDPGNPTQPDVLSPQTTYRAFLPLMVKRGTAPAPTPTIDLVYSSVEVTQGIQTTSNSVPLVAGRSTVARVYAVTNTGASVGNVRISISATRGGTTLAGSPVVSAPRTVNGAASRDNLATSFNVRLPAAWLSGSVALSIRLDSSNAVAERNESNNLFSGALNFQSVPGLNLKVVPITLNLGGRNYTPPSTAYLAPKFMKLYPISAATVTTRSSGFTYQQSSNSSPDWRALLDQATSLYNLDNPPDGQVYFGVVPAKDSQGRTWIPTSGSITAGIGWVGYPVSVGLADTVLDNWYIDGGEIAAHEVGHNLGRDHSPCGVSGDRNYPYPGGMIGNFGLDIEPMGLKSPTIYSDIMGYCDNQWISDYTYNALLNAQRTNAAAALAVTEAGPQPAMLVRMGLDGETAGELQPVYALSGYVRSSDAASEYAIEYLDAAGQPVGRYALPVLVAEEPGVSLRAINTLAPLPDAEFSSYRIVHNETTLAERRVDTMPAAAADAVQPPSATLSGDTLELAWMPVDAPAVVRYSTDSGQTWTTVALDHTGGRISLLRETLPEGTIQFEIIPAGRTGAPLTLAWENAHATP